MCDFWDLIYKAFGCNDRELKQNWGLGGSEYDTNRFYKKLSNELPKNRHHLSDSEYKWMLDSIKKSIDGLNRDN